MQRAARPSHAGCLPVSAASASAAVAALEQHRFARARTHKPAIILLDRRGKYLAAFGAAYAIRSCCRRNSAVGPSVLPKIDEKSPVVPTNGNSGAGVWWTASKNIPSGTDCLPAMSLFLNVWIAIYLASVWCGVTTLWRGTPLVIMSKFRHWESVHPYALITYKNKLIFMEKKILCYYFYIFLAHGITLFFWGCPYHAA
jgi:hypothetical protein